MLSAFISRITGRVENQTGANGAADVTDRMTGSAFASGVLADGTAETVAMAGAPVPASIYINPESGDTVSYWHSLDGGTTYTLRGAVAIYTEDRLDSGVTHLKFQRTAGSGTTSTYGVV